MDISPEELDRAVMFINGCMDCTAEKSVPICWMCSCSKPWWNNDLTTAFKEMRTAREMAKSYYQYFHHQSEIMVLEAKQLCTRVLHFVKTAKCEFYLKLTEEAQCPKHVELPQMDKWEMHIYIPRPIKRRQSRTSGITYQ